MLTVNKKIKLSSLINCRLKVSTVDKKCYYGNLLAFDKYLNLVLSNTEESRIEKKEYQNMKKVALSKNNDVNEDKIENDSIELSGEKNQYTKRYLGLLILRGMQIVGISIESEQLVELNKRVLFEKKKVFKKQIKIPISIREKLNSKSASLLNPIVTKKK